MSVRSLGTEVLAEYERWTQAPPAVAQQDEHRKKAVDLMMQQQAAIAAEQHRKNAFEDRATKEIAVCMLGQMPIKTEQGIVLKKLWLYRDKETMKESLKLVIVDLDGESHAFEGELADFRGCRNATDFMVRALSA